MFFYHNIRQNLHISVLILCFVFNIRLPIYKHVFFSPKPSLKILYLSIILESLKNILALSLMRPSWLLDHPLVLKKISFNEGNKESIEIVLPNIECRPSFERKVNLPTSMTKMRWLRSLQSTNSTLSHPWNNTAITNTWQTDSFFSVIQ